MMLIGVTGNYGSGKSTISKMFEQHYGLRLLNADTYAHTLYAPDGLLFKDVSENFDVVVDGKVDRNKLGKLVFENRMLKHKLENIVWPAMADYFDKTKDYDVLEAAMLFEAGWSKFVKHKLLVYIPEEKYLGVVASRGRDKKSLNNVLKYQWPQYFKKNLADFILDNSGTLSESKKQVGDIMTKIGVQYV